ncbi:cytoplasmic protein [Xenorhabdus sp. psl]|nr:cytoplasmic protein [Xenorhabdus sp. psl]
MLTTTELKKHGVSNNEIQALTPVLERQNGYNGEWYFLYKINKDSLPDAKK